MRKALSAVAIVGATVTGILVPAAAHAAAPPNVIWGYSVDDDRGRIQLNAVAEAGVASIVVHIVEPDTEQILAEVNDFTLTSGNEHDGVWVSGEVMLDRLCECRVEAEVTDKDGGHMPARYVGNLNYTVAMFFDGVQSTTRATYTDRDLTVSGRLLGRWPGTQAVAPVEGISIQMTSAGGNDEHATSASDGTFTIVGRVRSVQDTATIETLPNWEKYFYSPAVTSIAAPAVEQLQSRLTMRVDHHSVLSGTPITVTGTVSRRSSSGWAPAANSTVTVQVCSAADACSAGPIGSTVTDERGDYRVTVALVTGGVLRVSARDEPFLLPAGKQTTVTAFGDVSVADMSALRNEGNGRVTVEARLAWGRTAPATASVEIQFAETQDGEWRTVSTIDLGRNVKGAFSTAIDQPAEGWWRVSYAGVPHRFASAVGSVLLVPAR